MQQTTDARERRARLWAQSARRVWEKSAFYRAQWTDAGLSPDAAADFSQFSRLPFTTAADVAARSPFDFLTGPLSTVIRLRRCGGALRAFTAGDVGRAAERTARALAAGGVNFASALLLLSDGADEPSAAVQYAGEVLGAAVLPNVPPAEAPGLIRELGVNFVAGRADALAAFFAAAGARRGELPPLAFFFWDGVATAPPPFADAPLLELYGPPQLGCAGALFACGEGAALHVCEDDFYAEVVAGELVLTSLTLEAMPFVRYRTGLRAAACAGLCACGRTGPRIVREG